MAKKKTHEEFVQELKEKNPSIMVLGTYTGNKNKIECQCKQGHKWMARPANVLRGIDCPYCSGNARLTNDEFVAKLQSMTKTVTPLEEYKGANKHLMFQCLKDESHLFRKTPAELFKSKGRCPKCSVENQGEIHRKSLLNKDNKFGEKYPHLVKLLKNQNEAFLYSYGSNRKTDWICPICGIEVHNVSFKEVSRSQHLNCPKCKTDDSYPNKFMFALLSQLCIKFEKEYSPDWIAPKRYDFYFSLEGEQYIVEMDGGYHVINPNIIAVDKIKNQMAEQHGIQMIRIDCFYPKIETRFQYIVEHIVQSKLSSIFDLTYINFEYCHQAALSSRMLQACQIWDAGIYDISEIAKILKVDYWTVRRYLRDGEKGKLTTFCEDTYKMQMRQKRAEISAYANGQKLLCNETGEIFRSYADAERFYHCSIWSRIKNGKPDAGKLPDGTKLTWTKLTNKEYENILKQQEAQ